MIFSFSDNRILEYLNNDDDIEDGEYDVFNVFADNYTILYINHLNIKSKFFTVFMSPKTFNEFHALTVPSILYRKLEITFRAINGKLIIWKPLNALNRDDIKNNF